LHTGGKIRRKNYKIFFFPPYPLRLPFPRAEKPIGSLAIGRQTEKETTSLFPFFPPSLYRARAIWKKAAEAEAAQQK